jgi:hypothetical protein
MMKFIDSRRIFALFDLGCAAFAGALWYNWPQLSWWPLLIALLPWGLRLLAGQFPFQRTKLDGLLLLFLMTALVGLWAAYDREAAWAKFWLIIDGVLIYYALAGQPEENRWPVTGLLSAFGAGVAGYFLMRHDWNANPAKVEALNNVGLWWMGVRPNLNTHALHPNVAAGITALTVPLTVAIGLHTFRKRKWFLFAAALAALALSLSGILLGTSRGALLALVAALGVWGLWGLSGWVAKKPQMNTDPSTKLRAGEHRYLNVQSKIFIVVLVIALIGGAILVATYPGGLLALANKLPGPANAGSRVDLILANLNLIADFPFT